MEYENNYKSKYTAPIYQHYTILKKDEKSKKCLGRETPQGDGEQAQKSLFEDIFTFISINYNIIKLKLIHFFLIWNETKGLKIAKI